MKHVVSTIIKVVATFSMTFGDHTKILFIIKVKILVLIKWSCTVTPKTESMQGK